MALPNSVTVAEVCRVAPANDSAESLEELCLPLTFLDTRYLRFPPTERIYFFKLTGLTHTFFHSVVLPKLKTSLSQTLLCYRPLAGHLTCPPDSAKPIILYSPNDAGVWVTVAESSSCVDFDRLIGDGVREAADSRRFLPELPVSDTKASAIALQITLFPNKGFSIAIIMHHAVVDGKTVSMFLKAWAFTCQNGEIFPLPPELTPHIDRTAIKDPDGLDSFYLNHWLSTASNPRSLKLLPNLVELPQNLVRATFVLVPESIKKLKERVQSYHRQEEEFNASTYVVTCAYVTVCLVKARGGDSKRKVWVVVAVDCRRRLDPPIPENYLGNCVYVHDMVSEAGAFMEENGVAIIAGKLNGLIKGLDKKGVFDGARERHERLSCVGEGVQAIGIAGYPRFASYEEDFGWGKPEKVEITSIDRTGSFSLTESRDGNGGVEIGLVLPSHEMEAFASFFLQGP